MIRTRELPMKNQRTKMPAVFTAYLTALKNRPSRKNDQWERPRIIEDGGALRLSCIHYKRCTNGCGHSITVYLELFIFECCLTLCVGVRRDKDYALMVPPVARVDLADPQCFDYIHAGFASLGIELGDMP